MYIYYIIFCFHSENQCPTTHPHIELSIPMVVVTPGYTHGANTRCWPITTIRAMATMHDNAKHGKA